jgi:hypothetical protein
MTESEPCGPADEFLAGVPRQRGGGFDRPLRRAGGGRRRSAAVHRLRDRGLAALRLGEPAGGPRPRAAGRVRVHARHPPRDVPEAPVDDASERRLGVREGLQRAVQVPAQPRLDRAFDLPTRLGLDSDDPRCLGEVGHTGAGLAGAGGREARRLLRRNGAHCPGRASRDSRATVGTRTPAVGRFPRGPSA